MREILIDGLLLRLREEALLLLRRAFRPRRGRVHRPGQDAHDERL